jgi:PiT family inorganic phosphate transporter
LQAPTTLPSPPTWAKKAVALALGLGTMISWKRIVITVGDKIGKQHLTYRQGAAGELVAMSTNGAGVQFSALQKLLTAWILILPCVIMISGTLHYLLSRIM